MKYQSIQKAIFVSRPNRFIAHAILDGKEVIAHVRNTGRCKELLIPGVTVYLEPSDNPNRKTKFSLVAVEKGSRLINMDSTAPNKVVASALEKYGTLAGLPNVTKVQPEYTYGSSRLDFLLTTNSQIILAEVKGVTLEKNNIALFPDAPTQRGVKHIYELIAAKKDGYDAAILFVIQMEHVSHFSPNWETHEDFGKALQEAQASGVHILAYDCEVTPESLTLGKPVKVCL